MKKILVTGALLASMGASYAQGYVGAVVQMSTYNNGDALCEAIAGVATGDCDKRANGKKIYFGSVLSESWALEAAFVDFGKIKSTFTGPGGSVDVTGRATAFVAAAVLRAQIRQLTLSGKVGVAAIKGRVKVPGVLTEESQDPSLYLGAGLEYPVYRDVKIVGSYDFARAKMAGEKVGVSAFGLGAQIGF